MGNYGTKISKDGYDYDTTDNNLILNTKYPFLKILDSGTGTLTLSSAIGNKTVYTHSLGYKPMFYVWVTYINPATGYEIAKHRLCSWTYYCGLGVRDYYIATATTSLVTLDINTNATWSITGVGGNATLEYIYVVYYDSTT